jgi:hypothetical protein
MNGAPSGATEAARPRLAVAEYERASKPSPPLRQATMDAIDGPHSVVFDEAENRPVDRRKYWSGMHLQ